MIHRRLKKKKTKKTDVLVCPTRLAPRLTDLRADELAELMCAVQRVGRVVERVYKADGLTIACQVRCA
jgi:bis(5'-adenosyl)-triphosphatase